MGCDCQLFIKENDDDDDDDDGKRDRQNQRLENTT